MKRLVALLSRLRFVVSVVVQNLRDAKKVVRLSNHIVEQDELLHKQTKKIQEKTTEVKEWTERAGHYRHLLIGAVLQKGVNNYMRVDKDTYHQGVEYRLDVNDEGEASIKIKVRELRERKYAKTADEARKEARERAPVPFSGRKDAPANSGVPGVSIIDEVSVLPGRMAGGNVQEVRDELEQKDGRDSHQPTSG